MIYEMIVVGAGPGGISMAIEAIESGLDSASILLLEKSHQHSDLIRKFYPEDKLVTANYKGQAGSCEGELCITDLSKDEMLGYLDKQITGHSLNIHYNEGVTDIKRDSRGYFLIKTSKEEYIAKTCVIAIGNMGKPNSLTIEIPAALKPKVLHQVPSSNLKGQKILVVGGGDSASEYVQALVRAGAETSIAYRQETFFRMTDDNRKKLEALNVPTYMQSEVTSLEESNDKVEATLSHDNIARPYDYLIQALGGTKPREFLKQIGIKLDKDIPLITSEMETNQNGLFVVGDLSAGKKGGSINVAFNSSRKAIREICDFHLDCKNPDR